MTIGAYIENDWKHRLFIESFEDADRWFEMYPIEQYGDVMSFCDEWDDRDVKEEFLKAYAEYRELKEKLDSLERKMF